MGNTLLLYVLMATPLVVCVLAFFMRLFGSHAQKMMNTIHLAGITIVLISALGVVYGVYEDGAYTSENLWIHIDSLGGIFIVLLGVIGFLTGLYSIGYMNEEVRHDEISVRTLCTYYGFFHLFLFTMLLTLTTNNLIVTWVAIEATTLSSVFLVCTYGQRSSLEAAWKYVIICTVGVAFGLYGTVLVYSNAASMMGNPSDAIYWTEVIKNPSLLDPRLMQIAFIFVLIGFGTKMGLFPMHAWLPDAHSEAPSPVSALLSAVLLNCALLVVIRFYVIITGTIGTEFLNKLLLVFGFLSVAVAAFLMVVQSDMKRLLAYSSVENMGVIAIALGIGGELGIFAALLHAINHSVVKALLFCGSGNVLLKYGTRDMNTVKGLLGVAPLTAVLITGAALALGGMPPFNVFVSEVMIVNAGIVSGDWWMVVLLLLLLAIVLGGLVRMVSKTVMGKAPEEVAKGELGIFTTLPMVILMVLMLTLAFLPKPVVTLVDAAAGIVSQGAQVYQMREVGVAPALTTQRFVQE